MKKIYIVIIGLFSLLTYSCIKDKGNEFKPELSTPIIEGYQKAYTAFTRQDVLNISPKVTDEGNYDFFWTVFSTSYTPGAGVIPRGDTLARTKDLKYPVVLNPGEYFLVFNVRDKKTQVTQMITSNLTVSTFTMSGWYLLKDDGVKTDFDFIHKNGRIDNWMAFFNGGQSMAGRSIKSVFAGSFKTGLLSNDLYNVFMVISDQDAGIFRIDNGKKIMGFDNMFFTKPAVKKPQNVLQPVAVNTLHFINDGKAYIMTKGSLFSNPPVTNYTLSPIAAVGACTILFDQNSKSVVTLDGGIYRTLASTGAAVGTVLKNMDAEPIWIGGYAGFRSIALALFRKTTGEGFLTRLNATYGPLSGGTYNGIPILVQDSKTVPQTHGLMSADVIGGNHDADYIYYSKGNKVYLTDFASLPETLQVTLPAGETVTCIQHIKYPQPAAGVIYTADYLAIASYNNGNYKVYLHKISSIGTIQALSEPTFTGQGRISCVNYLENGNGNRTW
jgi:hypothetical protein